MWPGSVTGQRFASAIVTIAEPLDAAPGAVPDDALPDADGPSDLVRRDDAEDVHAASPSPIASAPRARARLRRIILFLTSFGAGSPDRATMLLRYAHDGHGVPDRLYRRRRGVSCARLGVRRLRPTDSQSVFASHCWGLELAPRGRPARDGCASDRSRTSAPKEWCRSTRYRPSSWSTRRGPQSHS
jgi:hypothetical protein